VNKSNMMKRQMDALEKTSFSDMKDKFTELYGYDCGQTNVRNLRKRLAYKIQEIHLGGLSDEDKKKINELADADPLANMMNDPSKPRKLTSGTRIRREWKGKIYEVSVLENNRYEFEGVRYRSLSAIADKITGTHWNGKKFFGVK